jgi:hypothetical protein
VQLVVQPVRGPAHPMPQTRLRRAHQGVAAWNSMDGKLGGDPAKLADALVQLAGLAAPPARFAAGFHPPR